MTDVEQAFNEICDQLGCAYDNEAALFAIDKLQKSAQSDAEPVAWQYRWRTDKDTKWMSWHDLPEGCVKRYAGLPDYETRALYAAPPRPDASAGLIEAADIAESLKGDAHLYTATGGGREGFVTACYEIAEILRARAADRSGK